jgi:hypothetical protein
MGCSSSKQTADEGPPEKLYARLLCLTTDHYAPLQQPRIMSPGEVGELLSGAIPLEPAEFNQASDLRSPSDVKRTLEPLKNYISVGRSSAD